MELLPSVDELRSRAKPAARANALDGQTWTRNSISIWSDIRKSDEERRLAHPALFPEQLVRRAMDCFMAPGDEIVLDPFAGSGATVVAAERASKIGIGVELYERFVNIGLHRLAQPGLFDTSDECRSQLIHGNAFDLLKYVKENSVDFVFTSPPYWDILTQKRTADYKAVRHYGGDDKDLGHIADYPTFVSALGEIFGLVLRAMRPGKYCIVNVMDLRKGDQFFSFHSDLAYELRTVGFKWDDMVIWDRRAEYNNMRPLGYPSVFRINKAHEFLLIFQKPR